MLSVALFSVLATAQADSMVMPCRPPTISASQPSPGQTDVRLGCVCPNGGARLL